MCPEAFHRAPRAGRMAFMSPREALQSQSVKGRRTFDVTLVGFIAAVAAALALGGTGVFN